MLAVPQRKEAASWPLLLLLGGRSGDLRCPGLELVLRFRHLAATSSMRSTKTDIGIGLPEASHFDSSEILGVLRLLNQSACANRSRIRLCLCVHRPQHL
jgi:hypothetical protein